MRTDWAYVCKRVLGLAIEKRGKNDLVAKTTVLTVHTGMCVRVPGSAIEKRGKNHVVAEIGVLTECIIYMCKLVSKLYVYVECNVLWPPFKNGNTDLEPE